MTILNIKYSSEKPSTSKNPPSRITSIDPSARGIIYIDENENIYSLDSLAFNCYQNLPKNAKNRYEKGYLRDCFHECLSPLANAFLQTQEDFERVKKELYFRQRKHLRMAEQFNDRGWKVGSQRLRNKAIFYGNKAMQCEKNMQESKKQAQRLEREAQEVFFKCIQKYKEDEDKVQE